MKWIDWRLSHHDREKTTIPPASISIDVAPNEAP